MQTLFEGAHYRPDSLWSILSIMCRLVSLPQDSPQLVHAVRPREELLQAQLFGHGHGESGNVFGQPVVVNVAYTKQIGNVTRLNVYGHS